MTVKGITRSQNVGTINVLIFLCTYVILGHPEVVCSGKGNHEIAVRLIP
jgi:hypothetical protein